MAKELEPSDGFIGVKLKLDPKFQHRLLIAVEEVIDSGEMEEDEARDYKEIRDLLLPGFWIELYRAVEDDDGDFDECREHTFKQREIRSFIRDELRLLYPKKPDHWISYTARKFHWSSEPEFIEFDSSNPSHACGYWSLRICGPNSILRELRKRNDEADGVHP